MYCYYCGKQINDDASFCRFCGMPASVPTEQAVMLIAQIRKAIQGL